MRSLLPVHEKIESPPVNESVKSALFWAQNGWGRPTAGDLRGKGTGALVLNDDDEGGGVLNELESG